MIEKNKTYQFRNKNVRLKKVTAENFYDLMKLSVDSVQSGFVAPNDYSLSEAYAVLSEGRYVQAFGIYDGDVPVGFAMIGHNSFKNFDCPDSYRNSYYLWRFMIDYRYQGRGFGKDGVKLILDYIQSFPDGKEEFCAVSYEPANHAAKGLYASFGFKPNGEMDDDEEIAVLRLE